jgi:transcriptional regulator with XRE-family HTH domain
MKCREVSRGKKCEYFLPIRNIFQCHSVSLAMTVCLRGPDNGVMEIGRAILEIRKERGLKQEGVALEAGTNTGHLSRIEQGVRQPSLDMLERLALALGVSITDVVSRAEGISARTNETLYVDEVSRLMAGLDKDRQKLAVDLVRALGQSRN